MKLEYTNYQALTQIVILPVFVIFRFILDILTEKQLFDISLLFGFDHTLLPFTTVKVRTPHIAHYLTFDDIGFADGKVIEQAGYAYRKPLGLIEQEETTGLAGKGFQVTGIDYIQAGALLWNTKSHLMS